MPNLSGNYGVHVVEDDDGALTVHVVPSDAVRPALRVTIPASGGYTTVTVPPGDASLQDVVAELQAASRLTAKYGERADRQRAETSERERLLRIEALQTELALLNEG